MKQTFVVLIFPTFACFHHVYAELGVKRSGPGIPFPGVGLATPHRPGARDGEGMVRGSHGRHVPLPPFRGCGAGAFAGATGAAMMARAPFPQPPSSEGVGLGSASAGA